MMFARTSRPLLSLTLASLLSLGCTPDDDPKQDADADTDTDSDSDTDVQWFGGDEGEIAIVRTLDYTGTVTGAVAAGVFANSTQGILNPASCLAAPQIVPCIRTLPTTRDTAVPVDPALVFTPAGSATRYVGLSVDVGPFSLPYRVDEDLGLSWYYANLSDQNFRFTGDADLELGVEWGPYSGDGVFSIPEAAQVLDPAGGTSFTLNAYDSVAHFEWVPGRGEPLLMVNTLTPTKSALLYLLTDDGSFDVDMLDLGFTANSTVEFRFLQWERGQLNVNGNDLTTSTWSSESWNAIFRNTGTRAPLAAPGSCAEAEVSAPYTNGDYFGNNRQDVNSIDGFPLCDAGSLAGRDAVVPIDLAPLQRLAVFYTADSAAGAIALQHECGAEYECIDADPGARFTKGETTTVSYFNSSEQTERVYLTLDAAFAATSYYELDLNIDSLVRPELADTCVQAQSTPLMTEAVYYGSLQTYFNDIDPGTAGCTSSSLSGADGLRRVALAPNETLELSIEMAGADPGLYLLRNCTQLQSCAKGSDQVNGRKESLIYQNTSAFQETLFLVVDYKTIPNVTPIDTTYTMTMTIR